MATALPLSEFERNLIKERAQACLATARARSRGGDRKPKLNEQQVREIRARLRAPDLQVAEVARRYGVVPPFTNTLAWSRRANEDEMACSNN